MVTLREAVNLAHIGHDEVCFLRKRGAGRYDYEILTGKQLRQKYDMGKIKVTSIQPHFLDGEYSGIIFEYIGG